MHVASNFAPSIRPRILVCLHKGANDHDPGKDKDEAAHSPLRRWYPSGEYRLSLYRTFTFNQRMGRHLPRW